MSYMIYLERVSQLIFKTLMPKQKKNKSPNPVALPEYSARKVHCHK